MKGVQVEVMRRGWRVLGGGGGGVIQQLGRLTQSRSTQNTCFILLHLAQTSATPTDTRRYILNQRERPLKRVCMNTLVGTNDINIHQYHAIGRKCTQKHILEHTCIHADRHRAAPASGWPINHVEREESRRQWSVSYSNNQSYISQIAYPTEQTANQTGRQRGGNHCL